MKSPPKEQGHPQEVVQETGRGTGKRMQAGIKGRPYPLGQCSAEVQFHKFCSVKNEDIFNLDDIRNVIALTYHFRTEACTL